MPRQPRTTVLKVDGPVILDFGNGVRIRLEPASAPATLARGRPGRKPSPATLKLIEAMQADAQAGGPHGRAKYVQLLQTAGGPASDGAAGQIVLREAKRIFGGPLGRGKQRRAKAGGKQASQAVGELRQKLAKDQAAGTLGDAGHYTRWLVDQPGSKLGLKQARPLVYRELRRVKT